MSLWKKKIIQLGKERLEQPPDMPSPPKTTTAPPVTRRDSKNYVLPGAKSRRCGVDNQMNKYIAGRPVDYSFRKVEDLDHLMNGIPREYRVGVPLKGNQHKYVTCLWASYNNLTNLKNLENILSTSLEAPYCVSWLDLSFNHISILSEEILCLRNLMILYLHGNRIRFLMEVNKLKSLRNLKTLTLHGNPIEEIPSYRNHIISMLPQISNLDFSLISKKERPKCI